MGEQVEFIKITVKELSRGYYNVHIDLLWVNGPEHFDVPIREGDNVIIRADVQFRKPEGGVDGPDDPDNVQPGQSTVPEAGGAPDG